MPKWLFACRDLLDPQQRQACALLSDHSQEVFVDYTISKLAAVVEPCAAYMVETNSRYEFDCVDMAFERDDELYILHLGWVDQNKMVTNAGEMPGIRLYGAPPGAVESPPSYFSLLFRSVLPELKQDLWFFPGGLETFKLPSSWYDGKPGNTTFEQMSQLLVYAPGRRGFDYYFGETAAAIDRWLPYIDNDWNEVYVFDNVRLSRDMIVRIEDEQPVPRRCPDAALAEWAKAYFYNYDGCYWSCYSWRHALLEAVKADLAASWGARVVEWSDLRQHRVTKCGVTIAIVECTLAETQRLHETPIPRKL